MNGITKQISKAMLINHIKMILCFYAALLTHFSLFSQNLEDSAALKVSEKYAERAIWYNNKAHYNPDSSVFYIDKAIEALDKEEPLHQASINKWKSERSRFGQKLSADEANSLSRAYQDKALWFKAMPHFNRDSTVFYFNMAALLLQNSEPLQYERLADLYLDITDRANRSHNFNVVDSLAPIGWAYYEKIPEGKKDKVLGYDLLINWALIKIIRGEPKLGLALFVKAQELLQDDPRPEIQLKLLKNKGRFYHQYGLPEEEELGIKYLKESTAGYQGSDYAERTEALALTYKLLAYYYLESKPDSTDYYMNQFEDLLPEITNPFHHCWFFYFKGEILIEKKEYAEATSSLYKTIRLLEEYNLTTIDIYQFAYYLLSNIEELKGNFDEAIKYCEIAKEASIEINTQSNTAYFLEKLSDLYALNGNYEKALDYYKEFSEINNVIEVERNQRSLRESELQANVLNQDKELAANQQKQIIYLVALTIGALLLLLLYRNYKLKQKSNQKLKVLNEELAHKNTLLDTRNEENELLLKEIHHRVKNNLELVKSLIALQSAQIEDPATKEAMIASQNRVQSMGIIHQKLYQGTKLGSIEMKDYFINLSEGILDTFNAEEKVKIECAMENLELDVDTAVPIGLIVNELLTNALKYAFPQKEHGTIHISLERTVENHLKLKIRDNGVGKVEGMAPKGTGFGSQLVQLLTQQLNGQMKEHSDRGTHIEFDFLLKKSA